MWLRSFVFAISLMTSNFALAESKPIPRVLNNPDQPITTSPARPRTFLLNQQFEIGINHSYHRYEEPGLMKIKGNQWGVNLAYNWYNDAETFRVRPELELLKGDFDYDGQTCSTVAPFTCTPYQTNGYETYRTLRVTGATVSSSINGALFTTFGGLAQRYLDNRIQGSGSYRREITYYYAPIGIEFATALSQKSVRLRALLEYDLFIYGIVKSHLSEVGAGDLTNHQTRGLGAKTSVAIDWFTDSVAFSFQPYVQYWKVEDSDVGTTSGPLGTFTGHEPKNNTLTGGLIVSILL